MGMSDGDDDGLPFRVNHPESVSWRHSLSADAGILTYEKFLRAMCLSGWCGHEFCKRLRWKRQQESR